MISDERYEVAENLRHLAIGHYIRYKEQFFDELAETVVGFEDYHDFNTVIEKLTDLIDPTCHIVLKPSDSDFNDEPHYLCSRCGKEGIDVYERVDYTLAGIVDHANHCSYCGARVVSGDGD